MDTQIIETSELTGAALRYAVAVSAGYAIVRKDRHYAVYKQLPSKRPLRIGSIGVGNFIPVTDWQPDRDWSQLGPLIERYQVQLVPVTDGWTADVMADDLGDKANSFEDDPGDGETPLIAACHAIAASHWGEYADIPSELVQEQSDE